MLRPEINTDNEVNKDNNEIVCAKHIDADVDYICDICNTILLSVENKEIESSSISGDGFVAVSGNMPKDTTVEIENFDKKEAISLAKKHLDYVSDNDILYAYDISLKANNNDYQPEKYNQSVNVKLSNLKLDKSKTYAMLHIKENGEKEVLPTKVLNENELEFNATSFSVYILVYAGSHTITFEGENYKVFDINGDEITDGATVTTGTKFNFIIKPNSGYGVTDLISIDSSGQNVLINSGYINIKGGMLVGIAEDLVVQVTTVLAPQITSHPVSLKVSEGQAATLSVSASGSGLTYLWQYRKRGEHNWSDVTSSLASGYNTNKITITATNYLSSGTEYRCVVGDANFAGNEGIKSEIAMISVTKNTEEKEVIEKLPKILKQPTMENAKVIADVEKASFNILALGDNLTFNWEYRENRECDWQSAKSLGTTTNTNEGSQSGDAITKSTFETNIVTYAMAGYEFRCVLGKTAHPNDGIVPSNSVIVIPSTDTIKADVKYINLDITKHPVSQKIKVGDKATFTVEANGGNTYKWQYKKMEDTFWTDCDATIGTGYNTNSFVVDTSAMAINLEDLAVTESFSGYKFRCMVNSSSVPEYVKTSEPAFLSVAQGDIMSEEFIHSSITGEVEIVGSNMVNSTLQGNIVSIDPEDCEFTYKWYTGDTNSIYDATEIEGATTNELLITKDYIDKYIFFGAIAASSNGYKLLYDVTTVEENVYDTVEYSVNLTAANVIIEVTPKVFQYDGKAKEPEVTVIADDILLEKDKDYTVSYSNNTEVGMATVIITGAGANSGEITENFVINPSNLDKDEITLDTKGPEITNIRSSVGSEITITANITDPSNEDSSTGSGVKTGSVRYAITFTEEAPSESSAEWQESNVFNMVEKEPIYLWVKAEDNLGNKSIQNGVYSKPLLMARETDSEDNANYMIGAERAELTQYTADKVKTITLLNSNEVPAGVEASWDVSLVDETYEIMAWIIPNGTLNGEQMYDLYIGGNGAIIASTGHKLFAGYSNCTEIKSLDAIDITKTENMDYMFENCTSLTSLNVYSFNTENVVYMQNMFDGCNKLVKLDLSDFNTSNVTNVDKMFNNCSSLEMLILGKEFTKLNGNGMFTGTSALTKIVAHNEVPMELSANISAGNQITLYVPTESEYETANGYTNTFGSEDRIKPILEVAGENPTTIGFGSTYGEEKDAGVNVIDYTEAESGEYMQHGYSVAVSGLPVNTLTSGNHQVTYTLNYKNPSMLSRAITTPQEIMTVTRNVNVTEPGKEFITEWTIPAGGATIRLPIPVATTNAYTVIWGDGTSNTYDGTTDFPRHTYTNTDETKYDIVISGKVDSFGLWTSSPAIAAYANYNTFTSYLTGIKQWGELEATRYGFSYCENLSYVQNNVTENTFKNVTDMSYMFNNCESLTTADLNNWKIENVTNMSYMFESCRELTTLNIGNWNTENLENMNYMFFLCDSLTTLNIGNLNTQSVVYMNGVFKECELITTFDLNNWNTENVTEMINLFEGCSSLTTLNIGNWNTGNVMYMDGMFSECSSLTELNLNNWNTQNVTGMESTFYGCSSLTILNICNWNTENVTNMKYMFSECTSLTTIDVSNWNTRKVEDMLCIFANCNSLTKIDLTGWSTQSNTNTESMFDMNNLPAPMSIDAEETSTANSRLKIVVFGPEFDMFGNSMFVGCDSLTTIITQRDVTSSADAISLSEYSSLDTLPNAILYVPDEEAEGFYENAINYATQFADSKDVSGDMYRIKPILELEGENPVTINSNEKYSDAGAKVAGYIQAEAEKYTQFGYTLSGPVITKDGVIVDASQNLAAGEYDATYTLSYRRVNGSGDTILDESNNQITISPVTVTREINVIQKDGNYSVGDNLFNTLLEAYTYIDSQLSGVGTIKVLKSYTDSSNFIVYEGRNITIDTNGFAITKTANVIENAGTLTIKGLGTADEGIYTATADVNTLGDLIVNKGILNIEGSNIVSKGRTNLYWYTIRQISKSAAQINMTGGTVKATFEVPDGNTAKPTNSGRAFEIGIGTFTMEAGLVETVNANYGLAITSFTSTSNASNENTINIKGGTIKSDKENAILISSSSGYTNPCILNISGGTIESPNAINIKNTFNGLVTITDGTINGTTNVGLTNESADGRVVIGDSSNDVAIDGPVIIGANIGVKSPNGFEFYDGILKGKSNGIYGSARDVVEGKPYGYIVTTGNDGDYKTAYLTPGGYYIVDDIYFDYLEEAYTYIKDGTGSGTIKVLISDWDKSTLNIESGDEVTIDLNGQTVTKTASSIVNSGKLTIIGNGKLTTSEAIDLIENNGEMIVSGSGTLSSTATTSNAVVSNNGTFSMTAGTINGPVGIKNNSGNVVIGNNADASVSKDKPVIIGTESAYYQANAEAKLEFYDGVFKKESGAPISGVSANPVTTKPEGYDICTTTEDTYTVSYLKKAITSVVLSGETFEYDGTPKTFSSVIVKHNEEVLSIDDYEITYENNVSAGIAKIIITGVGEYAGTIERTFIISKAGVNLVLDETDVIVSPGMSVTVGYTYNGSGDIMVSSADDSIATVTVDKANKQITITGVTENVTLVTATVSDTEEYVGESKTINVTVEDSSALFITEWELPVDADGNGNGTTIILPIPANVFNNFEVRWGDGTRNKYTTDAFPRHTYKNTAIEKVTIQIKGKVNTFGYFRTYEVTDSNAYSNYYTFTKYLRKIVSWGELEATGFGFANCTELAGTIPAATGFANLTSVQNMFYNCRSLTGTIPTDFLAGTSNITSAKGMFANCIGLNGTISADFFNNNTAITSFENTFAGCSGLTGTIPTELFNNMTEVTSYAGTFSGCSKLNGEIPAELFADSIKVKSFSQTFANCTGLVSGAADANGIINVVPTTLFANQSNVNNYYRTFYNCTGLTGIVDTGLFESNKIIVAFPKDESANGNFKGTFEGCTGITKVNIPTKVIGHEMFKGCTSLEEVKLSQAIDIGNSAFYGCNKLTYIDINKDYLLTVGSDAFEYTGTNPAKLFTQVNRENETLVAYDWSGDNRTLDIEAPIGRVEIVTDKYPFTNTQDIALNISLTDDRSLATDCEIAILNEDVYASLQDGSLAIDNLPWQAYIENTEWTLTSGDGIKTVYVLFKDEIGNISSVRKNIAG